MITLIIVDCQNDFITGTMSVKGAKNTVETIKKFIRNNKKKIEQIIFTLDWHPYNHCSFKNYGGELPRHCIQHTPGACIEPKLLKLVNLLEIPYQVAIKGEISYLDEYSVFNEIEYVTDELGERYYFDSLISVNANTEFVICGIYGDSTIKYTIENMIEAGIVPKIFSKGIVSTDGGKILSDYIKINELNKIS